ncbi:MAG: hypothetical protein EXR62_08535 [Chloroflexi bacterium]|nr:hypothetical protein [Chloroflexota bacterium]
MADNQAGSDAPRAVPETALLATKLFIPPARPSLVPRPRLTQRLDAGLTLKLILISAPAGSGKTTLLSEWRSAPPASEAPFAWVSLDEGDNDPARFWSYVVAALRRIQPGTGAALLELLRAAPSPPADVAMTLLINDLVRFPADFVLALDDYHLIDAQSIHQALAYLLDHLPPNMHLAIASRVAPPLPLSRLRGRGQMVELQAADLRFTAEEAAAFLNQTMGLGLTAGQVSALEQRTEGWIAGLQMAALRLQRRAQAAEQPDLSGLIAGFGGSQPYIVDYLVDEVLQYQPEAVQAFLLHTCILNRMCGPLCDALTGQVDGQAMLQQLESANLFLIPLDEERRWYRYHHLFGEALRKRLQLVQPQSLQQLHRQAAVWHEAHGLIVEAVEHALAAAGYDTAARLMEQHSFRLREQGEWNTILRWLQALPEALLRSRPLLCVEYATILSQTTLDLRVMEQYLQHAEEALRRDAAAGGDRPLRGRIADMRAAIAAWRGDVAEALAQAQLVFQFLPKEDTRDASLYVGFAYAISGEALAAEQSYAEVGKNLDLVHLVGPSWGLVQLIRGHLQRARYILGEALETSQVRARGTMGIVAAYLELAEILYEWNELDAALQHLLTAQHLLKQLNLVSFLVKAHYLLACVYLARGDRERTEDTIQQLAHLIPQLDTVSRQMVRGGSYLPGSAGALHAHLRLLQANLPAGSLLPRNLLDASSWAQASGLTADDAPDYQRLIDHLVLARVYLAQGQPETALRLLPRLLQQAENQGRRRDAIRILALQALALQAAARQAGGDIAPALSSLQRALTLAGPEGYIRTFVDEGQPMRELLLQVRKLQVERLESSSAIPISPPQYSAEEYLDRLLEAFGTTEEQARQLPIHQMGANLPTFQPSNPPLAEPLSAREVEVLRLIAEGLTNREIAQQLYITIATVKSHANTIFGKLQVNNRTQAVSRARALGLIPS